jgi:DNA-binding PadR family transcriptional regulator
MKLTITEQILLLTIWRLDDEAYGFKIREQVCKYLEKDIAFGTLYNNLDQVIRKGYVISYKGEPTATRGGKGKMYYRITDEGIDALQAARELQSKLWQGIPDLAFVRGK